LQYLLFNELAGKPTDSAWLNQPQPIALIMTSANLPGEPVITDNQHAKTVLANIADIVLDHDLNIVTHADDSILQTSNNQTCFIRRSRAFTPQAIELAQTLPPLLGVGGNKKNTFCLIRGNKAYVSQHTGDLNDRASIERFEHTLSHMQNVLSIKPVAVAHDLHPDFLSTHFAQTLGLPSFAIQHHHAHLAAVAAEHKINQPALGLVLDGYGMGDDQRAWGGELLLLARTQYQRLGHLSPLSLVSGDRSSKEPWRMAAAVLASLGRLDEIEKRFPYAQASLVKQRLSTSKDIATTSSCGRLFDAAASLLGVCHINHYEGQAAMKLESLVTQPTALKDGWRIQGEKIDFSPLLAHLASMSKQHEGANLFHGTLIEGLCAWVSQQALSHNLDTVLISGGCLLNQVLRQGLQQGLSEMGLRPLLGQQLPPNDAGISLGQAWLAGLKLSQCK